MIAGIMAVHLFPLDTDCLLDLLPRVQALALWLDQRAANRRAEFKALLRQHGRHLKHAIILDADRPWKKCSGWIWREPLMRALDDWRPSYVLQPDSDEQFSDGFNGDMRAFREMDRDLMLFTYYMPTADNTIVPTSPRSPHVKVIRWRPGLTFRPYRGYGRPNGKLTEMHANAPIHHYCFYTPQLQAQKVAAMTPTARAKFSRREPRPCT